MYCHPGPRPPPVADQDYGAPRGCPHETSCRRGRPEADRKLQAFHKGGGMASFIEARDVVCGFDVGKSFHHAFAMERATGEVLLDRRVAQDEGDIRAALEGPWPGAASLWR